MRYEFTPELRQRRRGFWRSRSPRMVHVAAHGGVLRERAGRVRERPMRFGEFYRAGMRLESRR